MSSAVECVHEGYPRCIHCGSETQLPEHVRARMPKSLGDELREIYRLGSRNHGSTPVGSIVCQVIDMHLDSSCHEVLDVKNAVVDLVHELIKLAARQHEALCKRQACDHPQHLRRGSANTSGKITMDCGQCGERLVDVQMPVPVLPLLGTPTNPVSDAAPKKCRQR